MVTLKFDLRDDVPADVGHVFAGKKVMKIYSQEHVPLILDCLSEKIKHLEKTTNKNQLDVFLYGYAPEQILMMIAAKLARWDDIETLWYGRPHSLPTKIFPM